ncbi:MAG TPA: radical SAM protein [Planctomycetota bacterium]
MDPGSRQLAPFDGRVPPPSFVSIETTRYCGLQCRMCLQFHDGTTVAGPHMPLEQFERIAEQLFPLVERWQPSVSGEPLQTQNFERMLAIAASFGVRLTMFTNGMLLNDGAIERLAPALDTLMVSFDGATQETFEFIRQGAVFEEVKARLRRAIQHCRAHLPADQQPQFGLSFTMMERNIRELPALVRLAAEELGVDFVTCGHMSPPSPEMEPQALAHHPELAADCIERARAVAEELGIDLRIGEIHEIRRQDFEPPHDAAVAARRAALAARWTFPVRPLEAGSAPELAGMPWCPFLWDRTYVAIGGDVRPCCVPDSPVVGNLEQDSFEAIWNGPLYRHMRQRLVCDDPAPICRGCVHVKRLDDPTRAARLLLGSRLPTAQELDPLPAELDPTRLHQGRAGPPPVLTWEHDPAALRYVVECSLDGGSLLYSTDGPRGGPAIRDNRYEVPPWAWRHAPTDRRILWRVIAKTAAGDRVVSSGSLASVQEPDGRSPSSPQGPTREAR